MKRGFFKKLNLNLISAFAAAALLFGTVGDRAVNVFAKDKSKTDSVQSLVGTEFSDERVTYVITGDATDTDRGSVKIIGNTLKKKTKALFLPGAVVYSGKEYTIREIGDYAFADSHFTELYMNFGIHTIGEYAFAMSSVTEVVIPGSVTDIKEGAFALSSNLKIINIGANVYDIATNAFAYCDSLSEINVDEKNLTYAAKDGILYNRKMTTIVSGAGASGDIVIPDTVTKIHAYAFEGNHKITSVTTGNGIKKLPENVFYDCTALESIYIPATVTKIEGNVFKYCSSLKSINVDKDNSKFASSEGMLLSSTQKTLLAYPSASGKITIPSYIKTIDEYAFCGARNLTGVVIPKNVKKILAGAFYDCEALCELYFEKRTVDLYTDIDSTEKKIFGNADPFIVINLPYSSKAGTEGSIEAALKLNCPSTAIFVNR